MRKCIRVKAFWQVGLVCLAFTLNSFRASGFIANDASSAIAAYNNAFYFTTGGSMGYFRDTTAGGTTWFWERANQMEMLVDIYEATTNSTYLTQFTSLYNGFVSDFGTDWTWNGYNDDIMWAVIACTRAYQKTGNATFRNTAKSNFDACYARAWSSDLGGGLWWLWPTNTSKNACVNGPAAIAAYLLYQSYNDTNYLTKANAIFLWERTTLVNLSTGQVYDHINNTGSKDTTPITYNEGTYLGAANYLGYTNEAMLAANYTKSSMCDGGILPQYDEDNDLGGFNGIFIRWMAKFMKDRNLQGTYQLWLQQNADAAWNVRRTSDNLSWSKWKQQTPSGTRYSFGCWGSVLALQVVPPTQTPGADSITLNASDASGTSSFESGLNWSDGSAPAALHNYVVSNSFVLRTPADNLHHNFAGSSLTLSNGGILTIRSTSSGRVITIGTGLILDNGSVSDSAAASAEVAGKATLRAGGGTFDPQGNSMTVSAQIAGSGSLKVEAATAAANGTIILAGYNTYTGGTLINAGHTLQLGGFGTLGDMGGSLTFSNTLGRGYGALDLNGTNVSVGNLAGAGGRILNNKSATTNTITIGNNNATGGVFQGTLINGIGTLALFKTGSGTIILSATSACTGGTTIAGGTLQLGDGTSKNGVVAGNITNNARLVFANPLAQTFAGTITGNGVLTKMAAGALTLAGTNSYSGNTLISSGALQLGDGVAKAGVVAGTITNNAMLIFANPTAQTFAGIVRGSGSLTKIGAGTLTLSGTNTYAGNTFVNSGTLALSGSGSIAGSANISIAGGAILDVVGRGDQRLTLTSGQTLTGSGTLNGNLTAPSGTILKPGDTLGTLTIQSNLMLNGFLLMELNRTNLQKSDQLFCGGLVASGGTLSIINLGPALQAGDAFQLFNQPAGNFATVVLPALDPGLYWTNKLAVDGSIQVLAAVSLAPTNLVTGVIGANMILSWPEDHIGWRLQMQAGSLSDGLGTNWVDVANSAATNQWVVPIYSTNASVFFRLIYP